MQPKLKSCPFCGGEPSSRLDHDHSTAWIVECIADKACPIYEKETWALSQAEAIAAWNTRAPADLRSALEAETDGLVEMLKAAQDWDGIAVFEHSPEEIGLEVMEHYQAVLAALAPTKGDQS